MQKSSNMKVKNCQFCLISRLNFWGQNKYISRQKQQKLIVDAMVYSQCLYYREYIILPLAQVRQHPQISGVSSPDVQHFGTCLHLMGYLGSLQGKQLRV